MAGAAAPVVVVGDLESARVRFDCESVRLPSRMANYSSSPNRGRRETGGASSGAGIERGTHAGVAALPVGRSQCAGPTGRSNPARTAGIESVFIVISAAAGTTLRRYSEKERWLCRHNPNYRPTVLTKSREAKSHNVKGAARASPSTHPGCKTVSLPRA